MIHDGVDDKYTNLIAEPGSMKYIDTTDNILYDTNIWRKAEDQTKAKDSFNN